MNQASKNIVSSMVKDYITNNIKSQYEFDNTWVVYDLKTGIRGLYNSIDEIKQLYNITFKNNFKNDDVNYLGDKQLLIMPLWVFNELCYTGDSSLKNLDIDVMTKYINLKYNSYSGFNRHVYFSMNDCWKNIAIELLNFGENINGTKELNNLQFTIINPESNLLTRYLPVNIKYLLGELSWYWAGSNDLKYISKFSKFWNNISDDGVTSNSAYGYVIQNEFGFNQISKIIELLKKDPYSRRAIININRANKNVIETKDEHCTISLGFNIRNGCLNMTTTMRSSDWNTGIRNDIPYFCSILIYIANKLNVKIGTYTHMNYSTHIYEKDYEKIEKSILNTDYIDMNIDFLKFINNSNDIYNNMNNENVDSKEILKMCIDKNILLFKNNDFKNMFKHKYNME